MQGKRLRRAVADAAGRPVITTTPGLAWNAASSRDQLVREIAVRAANANSNRQLATVVEGTIRDAGRFARAMRAGIADARRHDLEQIRRGSRRKGRRK